MGIADMENYVKAPRNLEDFPDWCPPSIREKILAGEIKKNSDFKGQFTFAQRRELLGFSKLDYNWVNPLEVEDYTEKDFEGLEQEARYWRARRMEEYVSPADYPYDITRDSKGITCIVRRALPSQQARPFSPEDNASYHRFIEKLRRYRRWQQRQPIPEVDRLIAEQVYRELREHAQKVPHVAENTAPIYR